MIRSIGTLPSVYGEAPLEIIRNHAVALINGFQYVPGQNTYATARIAWENNNQPRLSTAWLGKRDSTVIKLPHKKILLRDAEDGELIFREQQHGVFWSRVTKKGPGFSVHSLSKDISREILLSISVSLAMNILDSLYSSPTPATLLFRALIIGVVKGLVKCSSDILAAKEGTLTIIPQKCGIEILAETTAETLVILSGQKWNSGIQSGLKGLLKYWFEQIIKSTFILSSWTEAFLEVFKAGFKGQARSIVANLLIHRVIFGSIIGSIVGSVVAAGFLNIFIDQAFI